MTFMLSIIIGVVVLGIMVIIHELGHFGAAKACGIRVLAFSFGFGRVLLKKEINGTEYRLSAIPFGGYVKMAGEQPDDEHTGAQDEFTMRPKWQRAVVAIAGPLANYVSAIIMLWVMFMYGVARPVYSERSLVGFVADRSAAAEAGIMAGDSIVSMNGRPVSSWDDMENRFLTGSSTYDVIAMRNGISLRFMIRKNPKGNESQAQPPFGFRHTNSPELIGQLLQIEHHAVFLTERADLL